MNNPNDSSIEGLCTVLILIFSVGVLSIIAITQRNSKTDDPHKDGYCPNCYFEKVYNKDGNEMLIYKGCKGDN